MEQRITQPELTVVNYDNRGGAEVAYGYVYFSDGTRVAYTSLDGVAADATGGWEPITDRHEQLAKVYLAAQGVIRVDEGQERGFNEGVLYGKLPNNRPGPSVADVMFGRLS